MDIKVIDKIEKIDYEIWKSDFINYLIFNKNKVKEKNLKTLWKWLNTSNHPQEGIFALCKKNIIGHAHFRSAPNSVRGENVGFLDDIFVKPEFRKKGVANKLIKKLVTIGRKNKWELIRWNCGYNNFEAIKFYNTFAKKLKWHTFEIKL